MRRTIRNESVSIDDKKFEEVDFKDCLIRMSGQGSISLRHCTFEGCRFGYEGAAANFVVILADLYATGGGFRDMVEKTFAMIRENKFGHVPAGTTLQ